jgi:hypothetical protein
MIDFFAAHTKIGQLRKACLGKIREHDAAGAIPTNGRFLFYELEQEGKIPKAYLHPDGSKRARQPGQDVSVALMDLSDAGLVPWEWIIDETRELQDWEYAPSLQDYLLNAVFTARLDCWDGRPAPLVICEARSTKGVLSRVTSEYLAPITATNGQSGRFLITDVVPKLRNNDRQVLYIGDHEVGGPGDQIENNTRRYLEKYAERSIDFTRIALTAEQVAGDKRLQGLVIDKLDHRYKPARPYKAIECEAVGQIVLENLLRAALDALLPAPLAAVQVREAEERDRWRDLLMEMAP